MNGHLEVMLLLSLDGRVDYLNFEDIWCCGVALQLESLKQISLLEDLDDGWTKIGMHDLWHKFCITEIKVKKFNKCRVFLEEEGTELSCC